MDNKRFLDRVIGATSTILYALKRMDSVGVKSLIVVNDEGDFMGVLSIGDIQRAIIQNVKFDSPINSVLRTNPRIANPNNTIAEIKDQMLRFRMEFMPVISANGKVSEIYFWEDLFINNELIPCTQFNLPIVIMAGGLGTRLRPLTNVVPKPLIPYKEKTIIEEIMSSFSRHGCNDFYISVNYKGDLIQYYLSQQDIKYNLYFIKESKPMGTGGSLSFLKGKINSTFIVTNCDIIIDQDYSEIFSYHTANKNEITVVAALKHYPIPYGVLETGDNGDLQSFQEKPEITFKINSGMYILESKLLEEIPENTFFHITQLIEIVQQRGGRVGVFPVSERSWTDIGDWNYYINKVK